MVSISGYSSNPSTLLHGVPQGSVLGPILSLLYTQPLSQIIDRRSVSNSEFADDSQLYDSVPREQFDSLLSNMQSCVNDVKLWITQNKLQPNQGKLRHCSLILKTYQTFHSQPKSVKMIFVFQYHSGI